ncbi:MAG: hypothetical protein JW954_02390 [Dehalococcoidaceae bacterium]|nr:hypothetical protein [Dehalococcoidaceae bacterium]
MAKCILCGLVYPDKTGHDFNKCVERCRKRYIETHMQAVEASRALDQATELYRERSRALA